jgi:predicted MFS family arabinose efflux permease
VALPFVLRREGLPLEMFWLLALPAIPRWLKWAIALVVDNYGNARFGYRKSWIAPCTVIGALLYASLAWIPPSVAAAYAIVAILTLKSFVMAAQDIAVDGYAAESMTDAERPVGTSIIVFLATAATVLGAGTVALVEAFGWSSTMFAASLLLVLAAAPALLRRESPPPVATLRRRERGERPDLIGSLRRRESLYILPYLFLFGFGGAFFSAMVGPFLADKGLTLTEFGILAPLSAIAASGAGAIATPLLVARLGLRRTAMIGIALIPLEGVLFGALALMPALPVLPAFAAMVAVLGFGTSVYTFAVNNSRFRWVSQAQAGTDYSLQSSVWNFGIWVAGSVAGVVAGAVGWVVFFPFAAALAAAFGVVYLRTFDRIEALVLEREARESEREADAGRANAMA